MSKSKFKTWSPEEQQTWQRLAERQFKNAQGRVSQIWFDGFENLEFSEKRIPDFNQVNSILTPLTDWKLVESYFEYADGPTWFGCLNKSEFLVTDYIRPLDSLDYTPKPDMFHDAFGHQPFLVNPQLSRIIRTFSRLIMDPQTKNTDQLGHVWWYTIEFGLVKEKGEVRAIGAGLASSFGELNRVFSGVTKLEKFDPQVVGQTEESSSQYHDKLFVHESLDSIETILANWPLEGI